MKNYFIGKTLIASMTLLLSVFVTNGQISQGGQPVSFGKVSSKSHLQIPVENLGPIGLEKLLKEDKENKRNNIKSFRFAKSIYTDFDLSNSGVWETLGDGSRLWTLGIESPKAYSLNITFSQFYLPEGAKLFLYNAAKDHIIGAFTNDNNNKAGVLATEPVYDDKIYIELYIPKFVIAEPLLRVGQIGHDYTGAFKNPNKRNNPKASASCNIDVNCEEGDLWQREKRAVCKILIDNAFICTGTLVNNTNEDGRPLFLTANHCVDTDPKGLESKIVYIFNREKETCNGRAAKSQSISGSTLRATIKNLDFCLYELSSTPPASYKPYYVGWDISGKKPTSVTSIHHPSGDYKKISGSNGDTKTNTFSNSYDSNTHWNVPSWDYGTTEGGSSGSALFDQNHRLIGDLTGGAASCARNLDDYYAQLHHSWDDYPKAENQLKVWLDPNNSGAMTLDGYDPETTNPNPTEQSAFKNHSIPGVIQAEDYDNGGQGVAYNDTEVRNIGQQGRIDQGVDLENTKDNGGGTNIGWTANGEWLEYTVANVTAGTYDIQFRVASNNSNNKSITAKLGNTNLGSVTIPNTQGWQNWQNVIIRDVAISSGSQVLRLDISGGGFNINWFEFNNKTATRSKTGSKNSFSNTKIEQIQLYPNPATNTINLNLGSLITSGKLTVFDNLGRPVKNVQISNQKELAIDVSTLAVGLYHVTLFADDAYKLSSFIKAAN